MQVQGPIVHRTWQRVPSVRDLQCAVEAAWRDGFDVAGGAQLDYRVVRTHPDQGIPAEARGLLHAAAAD